MTTKGTVGMDCQITRGGGAMGWKRGGSDGGLSGLSGLPAVLGKNCIQTNRDNPDVLRHIIKNVSKRLFRIIESRGTRERY